MVLLQGQPSFNYQNFIPGVFLLLAVTFGSIFFMLNQGGKTVSVRFFIIYSLITAAIFALIAVETFWSYDEPVGYYTANLFVFTGLGVLHAFLVRKYIGIEESESFLPELIFTAYVTLLGALIYTFLFSFMNHGRSAPYTLVFATSIISMIIPFFIYRTFIFFISIPVPEYKKWYYPVGEELNIDEELFEDKNVLILELEIALKASDPVAKEKRNRIKAHHRLEWGKYFAIYVYDYNDIHAGQNIEVTDEFSQPYGWNFYVKPKWYQSPRYLNPDLTVAENNLSENDIVVAERIID